MDPIFEHRLLATRRHLLGSMAGGIGAAALGELLGGSAAAGATAAVDKGTNRAIAARAAAIRGVRYFGFMGVKWW